MSRVQWCERAHCQPLLVTYLSSEFNLLSPWLSNCMGGNQKLDIMALGSVFCFLNWFISHLCRMWLRKPKGFCKVSIKEFILNIFVISYLCYIYFYMIFTVHFYYIFNNLLFPTFFIWEIISFVFSECFSVVLLSGFSCKKKRTVLNTLSRYLELAFSTELFQEKIISK